MTGPQRATHHARGQFQSTPSVWRETMVYHCGQMRRSNFNPLPPCGGRPSDEMLFLYKISETLSILFKKEKRLFSKADCFLVDFFRFFHNFQWCVFGKGSCFPFYHIFTPFHWIINQHFHSLLCAAKLPQHHGTFFSAFCCNILPRILQ